MKSVVLSYEMTDVHMTTLHLDISKFFMLVFLNFCDQVVIVQQCLAATSLLRESINSLHSL